MLPAGMELRPSLQLSEKVVAVGFPGENVPDPFCSGELAKDLPSIVAWMHPSPMTNSIVVDLRNVREITAAGIYVLKSLRPALREHRVNLVLVVRTQADEQFMVATGVRQHIIVVVGEEGLRAWLARIAEYHKEFSEENIRKMLADNITHEDLLAAIKRARGEQ